MRAVIWFALLWLAGCQTQPIHQGNVLKEDALEQIAIGDSRFRVETLLGSPAVIDPLHARRVYYIEQFEDDEHNKAFVRRVEIRYDKALRVQSIRRIGFAQQHGG